MKTFVDGLMLYEIVLLVLGGFLFLILCVGLLYYIIRKEPVGKLLLFFFVSIVMIGYPSITQITVSNDKIELTKLQKQVIADPENKASAEKMEQLTEKLEKRASTPEDLIQISTSNLLLGNSEKAASLANDAISAEKVISAEKQIPEEEKSDAESKSSVAQDIIKLAALQKKIAEINEDKPDKTALVDSLVENTHVNKDLIRLKPLIVDRAKRLPEIKKIKP